MKIVVKVGSSTLTYKTGNLNIRRVEQLCKVLADLKNAGNEVILVSSGAIAMGVGKLGLSRKPEDIPGKQAAAAVGQCELMYVYDKMFSQYNHVTGQILITGEDVTHKKRFQNFTNAIGRMLEMGVLPIINENDTISTKEIKIGDNDTLSALVARSVQADLLVLLTDRDGLFTADPSENPKARLIRHITEITPEIMDLAGDTAGTQGTGGMHTKLEAAQMAMEAGIDMVIAGGSRPEILYDIVEGREFTGTYFDASEGRDSNGKNNN